MEILIDAAQIAARMEALGREISDFYRGKKLTLLCLANGGVFFGCALAGKIDMPCWFDVAALESYHNDRKTGDPVFRCSPKLDPSGRHILVIDDVLDSGETLRFCKEYLKRAGAADVRSAVLVTKKVAGRTGSADWSCFDAPDRYLIGCGMDSCEEYRNLPYIAALD